MKEEFICTVHTVVFNRTRFRILVFFQNKLEIITYSEKEKVSCVMKIKKFKFLNFLRIYEKNSSKNYVFLCFSEIHISYLHFNDCFFISVS